MPPLLKKILVGILAGAFLLVLLAVAVAAIFEDEIGKRVITEVNKQIETELIVEDFNLSLLRYFPDASAELVNAIVADKKKGSLLEAERISFRIGLFSLFKEKKEVRKIAVENGALNILIDKNGRGNYDILRKQEKKEESGGEVAIDLEQAALRNVNLVYTNQMTGQEASVLLENAVFSGEFSAEQFALESMAKMKSNFIKLEDSRYLVDKNLGYSAKIFVNLKNKYYDFEKLEVAIEKNVFSVDGFIDGTKEGTDYDLVVHSKDGNIESVIQLLPEQMMKAVGDFSGKGNFAFEASVKGRMTKSQNPDIRAEITLEDGRITSPRLKSDVKDVGFTAFYKNGKKGNSAGSVFEVKNFKGYIDRELVEMSLKVQNTADPVVDFKAEGTVPIEVIAGFFENPAIKKGSGELEVKNLSVTGRYKDMLNPNAISRVKASGELLFDDAALVIHEDKLLFDRGKLALNNNLLTIEDLKIDAPGTEIFLAGRFENLLPVLFADSLNSKDAQLVFTSTLKAPKMDVQRLVALTKVPEEEKKQASEQKLDSLHAEESAKRERFTRFLNGKFEAEIEEFQYNKIEGEDFRGSFVFANNELQIQGSAEGMEGHFELNGNMYFEKEPYLKAEIACNEINIKDFFEQAENFGQQTIKAENVSGSMSARISIDAYWNEKGEFDDEKLHAMAALGIENGELVNVKLLESFSKFIHLEDLRHIRFVDMINWLEIRNRTVYIPAIFIRSNALNLMVSGEQSFDDKIDYNFKINAGQVLVNLLKPHNPSLEPQKAQRNGWLNLYYNMHGTVDDYKVTTNRRKVKLAITESERRKRQVMASLTSKFGPIDLMAEPYDWQDEGTAVAQPASEKTEQAAQGQEDEYIEGF